MRRAQDFLTLDLFEIPVPRAPLPGALDIGKQLRSLISHLLKESPLNRYEIAARMSEVLATEITKHKLDSWTAESREGWRFPLEYLPALEVVLETHEITAWLADLRGCRVLVGKEALDAEIGKLERMGARELKNIQPFIRRDFSLLEPNDVWSADGHTFDAEVQHPFHGRPFRPEITTFVDIATRKAVGWSVDLAESGTAVADALRHSVERHGSVALIYVDNGGGYLVRRGQLTQTYSWMDLWHDQHAEQFTVSRLARLDLLKAMQEGITQSVKGDLSRRDWMRNAKALLQREGWWGEKEVLDPVSGETVKTKFDSPRLKLIYDTNARMAYSAARWERAWRSRASHPYVRYVTRRDDRVRAAHRAWDNLVLPVDDPFWEKHWPPNALRCRCDAVAVSQREYDMGYSEFRPAYEYNPDGTVKRVPEVERIPFKKEAPPERTISWTNKRTGEVSQVPEGIMPGFDYNHGLARVRRGMLQRVGVDKLNGLPGPMLQAAMTPTIGEDVGADFAQAVVAAYGQFPEGTRKAIAAAGYEVKVVNRIVNAAPDLTKKAAAGLAYEQIDGLTHYAQKRILVAEQAFDAAANTWRTATGVRGAAVLAHEVGHALDEILKLAESPAVASAWRKESAALAGYLAAAGEGLADEIQYFTQSWPRGALETVAELYALRQGTGTATFLNVAGAFPETRAALEQVLAEKGL